MTALPDIPRLYTALAECLAVLLFTPALVPRFSRAVTAGVTLLWAAVLLVLMLWNSLQQEMLRFLLWR